MADHEFPQLATYGHFARLPPFGHPPGRAPPRIPEIGPCAIWPILSKTKTKEKKK